MGVRSVGSITVGVFATVVLLGAPAAAQVSRGYVASSLGGTRPIPRGTSLALGLGNHLARFTEQLNDTGQPAVHVVQAYDLGYFVVSLDERSLVAYKLTELANVLFRNGGRLKFNLESVAPHLKGITEIELTTILKDKRLEARTDFFIGGRRVTGPELKRLLAPFRN